MKSFNKLKDKSKLKTNQLFELEKSNQHLLATNSELKFKYDLEHKAKQKLEETHNQIKAKYEELAMKQQHNESKVALLNQKSSELEKSAADHKAEAAKRKEKNTELAKHLKSLELTYSNCNEELKKLSYTVVELKRSNDALFSEREKLLGDTQQVLEENSLLKEESTGLAQQVEETAKVLKQQEHTFSQLSVKNQQVLATEFKLKHKKNKIKNLQENNAKLNEQLRELTRKYDCDLQGACLERDAIHTELEEIKHTQNTELTLVESQIVGIEREIEKLRFENAQLLTREQELAKELRTCDADRERYKQKSLNLKKQMKEMASCIEETETILQEVIQQHNLELEKAKRGGERGHSIQQRLRALDDVQSMIKAHKAVY